MTLTYMWSKGVHACSIHVTRVISFALVNICKIIKMTEKKKQTNCNWKKVAEHNVRNPSLVVLWFQTQVLHTTTHQIFFSVPPSLNLLFCPVSLSIKSPFTSGDFLTYTECLINHLTSFNDQERISTYQIITISNRQETRIRKNISSRIISWFNTKFLELTS